MGIIHDKLMGQFRKPKGIVGNFIIKHMNEEHFDLTTWGLKNIDAAENSTILDAGCGGGRTISRLLEKVPKGRVLGIDYSLNSVKMARKYNSSAVKHGKVEIFQSSIEKLPFDDNKFDMVTAVETVYFWPDILENFKEARRVLKSSGKFVVVNEVYKDDRFKERNERYCRLCNMKIHTPQEMKDLFKQAGFENIKVDIKDDKNWMRVIGEK